MKHKLAVLGAILFLRGNILNLDVDNDYQVGGLTAVHLVMPEAGFRSDGGNFGYSLSGGPILGTLTTSDHYLNINGVTISGGSVISYWGAQTITENTRAIRGYRISAELTWKLD